LTQTFDSIAEEYDCWYDSPEGRAIFDAELKCLQLICPQYQGRWLEVGVGTGRFASALGIAEGIDPSPRMLEIAARRSVGTYEGRAEKLAFPEASFDGVLMALTLCFVANAEQALKECLQVLRSNGRLLIGAVPADSHWGKEYIEKISKGHPIYARAHFRTASEIVELAQSAGFALIDVASTLFWKLGEEPQPQPQVKTGIVSESGFLGLLLEKSTSQSSGDNVAEGDR
jgi:ubiquinone/menaquinone biosynthesis C-methylase UbiE